MIKHAITRISIASTVIGSFLFAGVASAIDWNITGFVRQEIAYGISSQKNVNNIGGDRYNDQIVPHTTHAAFNAQNALDGTSVYVSPTNGAVGLFGTGAAAGVAAPSAAAIKRASTINSGFGPNWSFKKNTAEDLTEAQWKANNINIHAAGNNTNSPVNCRFGGLNAVNAGSTGLYGTNDFIGVSCGGGANFSQLNGLGSSMTATGGNMDGSVTDSNQAGTLSAQGAALNEDRDWNMFNSRAEIDIQAKFNRNWAA